MKNPTFAILTFVPKRAQEALDSMAENRKLNRSTVERYAMDMLADRWEPNGEPLIFDEEGRLLDGQHRCAACVKANVPFRTAVITGVPRAYFHTIDQGKSRSVDDVLTIKGVANGRNVAAVARAIALNESGRDWFDKSERVTVQQIEDIVARDHDKIQKALSIVRPCRSLVFNGIAAYVALCGYEVDPIGTERFFAALATGDDLKANDPILLLRNRLVADRLGKARLVKQEVAALLVKAFAASLEGQRLHRLRWQPHQESFPFIPGQPIVESTKGKPFVEWAGRHA